MKQPSQWSGLKRAALHGRVMQEILSTPKHCVFSTTVFLPVQLAQSNQTQATFELDEGTFVAISMSQCEFCHVKVVTVQHYCQTRKKSLKHNQCTGMFGSYYCPSSSNPVLFLLLVAKPLLSNFWVNRAVFNQRRRTPGFTLMIVKLQIKKSYWNFLVQ